MRRFQQSYNEERPHQALGNATPAKHYAASPRRFDGVLREPDYEADYAVRQVRHNGEIRWHGNTIYLSAANHGGWTAWYGPIELGLIAHGDDRLRRPKTLSCRLVDNAARCPQGPQSQPQQRLWMWT